jgi:hypothetical protein
MYDNINCVLTRLPQHSARYPPRLGRLSSTAFTQFRISPVFPILPDANWGHVAALANFEKLYQRVQKKCSEAAGSQEQRGLLWVQPVASDDSIQIASR